jgi:hypothetical protein
MGAPGAGSMRVTRTTTEAKAEGAARTGRLPSPPPPAARLRIPGATGSPLRIDEIASITRQKPCVCARHCGQPSTMRTN